jgi:hypothetical protein
MNEQYLDVIDEQWSKKQYNYAILENKVVVFVRDIEQEKLVSSYAID